MESGNVFSHPGNFLAGLIPLHGVSRGMRMFGAASSLSRVARRAIRVCQFRTAEAIARSRPQRTSSGPRGGRMAPESMKSARLTCGEYLLIGRSLCFAVPSESCGPQFRNFAAPLVPYDDFRDDRAWHRSAPPFSPLLDAGPTIVYRKMADTWDGLGRCESASQPDELRTR